ncbi:MAG: DUF2905 domain-containing protein [Anaerolineales bacterium]|nr:MAG: DUF2905 domain-containing protein [Anaerolineales bacterium]
MEFTNFGKTLLVLGGLIALSGLFLLILGRFPPLGRLPGDITFRRGNFSCYIPIVTSILLSVLLTILLNLLLRLLGR